ncbi:tetratricopeptide repeat protein [Orrella sp. 11846]|uniref:tetratricopeptide repeat protein n=1 Tax=Orrella sp. 11846 TaxID=3409913 RepID=UPI003B5B3D6F
MRTVWLGCLLSVVLAVGGGVVRAQESNQLVVEKAAQGDASAQLNLGVLYRNGYGVRQDYVKAREWFGKACDNGDQRGCDEYRVLNNRR